MLKGPRMCTPQTWRPFSPLSKPQGSNSPTATRQASACEVSPALSKKLSSKRPLVTPAGKRHRPGVRSKASRRLNGRRIKSGPLRANRNPAGSLAPRLRRRRAMAPESEPPDSPGRFGFQNGRADTSATFPGAFDLARCGGCPQKPSGSASRGRLSRCRLSLGRPNL